MSYNDFSSVYDSLMSDVDYTARCEYLIDLFKKYGKMPTLMLDLACGTGGFSNAFAKKGVEVIGVDVSQDMLSKARENSYNEGTDVLYLCQSAEELDLFGTVDGAICCMDSLNHITDFDALLKAVKNVSLFLENECLFIFDLNTEYKHRHILGNNTFVIEEDNIYCVWQNNFDEENLTTDIYLDFFKELPGGLYERSCEDFSERAYTENQMDSVLEEAGLEKIAVFDDMSMFPQKENSERIIYVTKKRV